MPEIAQDGIGRSVSAVLAAASALSDVNVTAQELRQITAAQTRGYFLTDEDEAVRLRYLQYLSAHVALTEILSALSSGEGWDERDWIESLPKFIISFAAACVLVRVTKFLTELAMAHPVLWKKLDEEDRRMGLPRKTFTRLYRSSVSPRSLSCFREAAEFYQQHREEIGRLVADPFVGPVVALLAEEETRIDQRKREALKRHLVYRWFSFRRRHRSAWRQVMFGLFEAGGSAIAQLRQPGIKPSGAPKRLTPCVREQLLETLRPGDVCVTRHDDALSNLFLPGFWPHATLYLGGACERLELGLTVIPEIDSRAGQLVRFLEAKRDGVRFRPAEETLAVDACVVLRPPLAGEDLARAIGRAMEHEGKLYDFLFDFRTSDRLSCTEVIYRGFHGIGPVAFELKEVSGRKCLPAEALLDQALACGFRIHAGAGIEADTVVFGSAAEKAFWTTR